METKHNISLISHDIELHKKLSSVGYFAEVYLSDSLLEDNLQDIVIISDRNIPFNTLQEQLHSVEKKETRKVFYMLSNSSLTRVEAIKPVLESKGVTVIPPKLTIKQIVEKACTHLGIVINTNKNVFAFFGADSKVGVTSTVQSIGELLSINTKSKVCILNTSGQYGVNYYENAEQSSGLDNIKPKLINNILSGEELSDMCFKKGNLSILSTSRILTGIRHFYPEHIETLISLSSRKFDIVLIDGGFDPKNVGLYVGTLNSTLNKYLITTQQESARIFFDAVEEQVLSALDISTQEFLLIVNKYQPIEGSFYTSAQLANMYKMNFIGQIKQSMYGWQAESDRKSLHILDSEYAEQVEEIAKIVAQQLNIEYIQQERKKKLFGIF